MILIIITFFCCDLIEFVVVHNGIITNYKDIKKFLVRIMCKYSYVSISWYFNYIMIWLFKQIKFSILLIINLKSPDNEGCTKSRNLISALWNTQNSLSWILTF